jgi:penicillin-binding protein 1A
MGNDDFTPMKQVTGGLLPAGVWHDIMLWAEQPQVATALPGVPVEPRYLQYAMENPAPPLEDVPDMSADDVVPDDSNGDSTQTAAVTPDDSKAPANNPAASPQDDKTAKPKKQKVASQPQPPEEDVAIVRSRESDDPVVSVLKDMFSIFSSNDDEGSVKRKRKDSVLVLPDANTNKKRKSNVKYMNVKSRDH